MTLKAIISINGDRPQQSAEGVSRSRSYKIRWRLEGKCENCGGNPEAGKTRCRKCLDGAAVRASRVRKKKGGFGISYRARKEAGLCTHCGESPKENKSTLCTLCSEEEWGRRIRIKKEVIDKYGGSCRCCGETNIVFLSIDHVNGGGTKERTETKKMGGSLYKHLRKLPMDPSLQVLCYNCNLGKGSRTECPHKYMDRVERALNWSPKAAVRRNRKWT